MRPKCEEVLQKLEAKKLELQKQITDPLNRKNEDPIKYNQVLSEMQQKVNDLQKEYDDCISKTM